MVLQRKKAAAALKHHHFPLLRSVQRKIVVIALGAHQKKDPLRLLTHMYTGQNWLKDNLSKRDINTDPICTSCRENRETANHFISECPAYATVRLEIFGVPYISLSDIITNFGPEKLLKYIYKTGRTKSDYFPI